MAAQGNVLAVFVGSVAGPDISSRPVGLFVILREPVVVESKVMLLSQAGKNSFCRLNVLTISLKKSAPSSVCIGKVQICNGAGLNAHGGENGQRLGDVCTGAQRHKGNMI